MPHPRATCTLDCWSMFAYQHLQPLAQVPNVVGFIEEGKKVAKKQMDITLHGLWGPAVPSPLQAYLPSCTPIPMCNVPLHIPWHSCLSPGHDTVHTPL